MADGNIQRLERDVEDLLIRVRKLETLDSTAQRSVIQEFRDLQKQVQRMDVEGTHITQERMRALDKTMDRVEKTLEEKADEEVVKVLIQDQKDNRRMVKAALIASAASLGAGIILYLIERAGS